MPLPPQVHGGSNHEAFQDLQAIRNHLDDVRSEALALASLGRAAAPLEERQPLRSAVPQAHESHEEDRAAEEARRRQQAELALRERDLALREQRLAEREAEVAAREQRLGVREADLADRWKELTDRQEQWRQQHAAEAEELQLSRTDAEQMASRLRDEEERLRELRRQLDERDLRWAEATKDAHVLKHHLHVHKPRLSPRGGKENMELMRQLEEQRGLLHEIKRKQGSWGSEGGGSPPGASGTCSTTDAACEVMHRDSLGSDAAGAP